jgi:hypothetical protein
MWKLCLGFFFCNFFKDKIGIMKKSFQKFVSPLYISIDIRQQLVCYKTNEQMMVQSEHYSLYIIAVI